jgi:hypothetical protein
MLCNKGVKMKLHKEKQSQNKCSASSAKGANKISLDKTDPNLAGRSEETHQQKIVSNKTDYSAQFKHVAQMQNVIQRAGEPATYRAFLKALVAAGYQGAAKAHFPHKGSEVKDHFYTDKLAEARAFAEKYPNAGVDLAQLDVIDGQYV